MDDIPWLAEVLTVLAKEGVEAAEKVIERALKGAAIADRVKVGSGWVEILVADGRSDEATALLDALIAKAPSLSFKGRLCWRLARLRAALGDTERAGSAAQEAVRLGAVDDRLRVQAAADAVGSVDNADHAPQVTAAHAVILGAIRRSEPPRTRQEMLQLAWNLASSAGDHAHAAGARELEAWSAILMSNISGMMGEHGGAIQLAAHAADASVDANHPLAFCEATRSLARWTAARDGDHAAERTLEDALGRWQAHFNSVGPNPISEWLDAWSASYPEA